MKFAITYHKKTDINRSNKLSPPSVIGWRRWHRQIMYFHFRVLGAPARRWGESVDWLESMELSSWLSSDFTPLGCIDGATLAEHF